MGRAALLWLFFALALCRPALADTPLFKDFKVDPCLAAGTGVGLVDVVTQQPTGSIIFTTRPNFSVMSTVTTPSGSPTGLNGNCASYPEPNGNKSAIQGLWKLNGNGTDSSPAANDMNFTGGAQYLADAPPLRNITQSWAPNGGSGNWETFESGNFTAYPWVFSGAANWVIGAGNGGGSSGESPQLGAPGTACIEMTKNVKAGNVTFDHRENLSDCGIFDIDELKFTIDGAGGASYCDSGGWTNNSFAVAAGNHVFKWCYTDGFSGSDGEYVLIDNVKFPPDNNAVIAQSASVIPLNNTDFTLETWFKWRGPNTTSFQTLFLDCAVATTDQCLHVGIQNDGLASMRFWSDDLTSSVSVADGQWHHLAFVLAGITKNIFIDGAQRNGSASGTQAVFAGAPSTFQMGGWPGTENVNNGLMNSPRVYRRALTKSEIQTHALGQIYKIQANDEMNGVLSGRFCPAAPAIGTTTWQWNFNAGTTPPAPTLPLGTVSYQFASSGADETFGTTSFQVTLDQTNMAASPDPVVANVGLTSASWRTPTWYCDASSTITFHNTNITYSMVRDWSTTVSASSRYFTDLDLTPNALFGMEVQNTYKDNAPGSGGNVGPSPKTNKVTATTYANVPAKPTLVAITGPTSANIGIGLNITPNPIAPKGNPPHTAIDIEGSTSGVTGLFSQLEPFQFRDLTGLTRSVTGLGKSKKYHFQSRAINLDGVLTAGSGADPAVFMITQPETPINFTGVPAQGGNLYCPKTQLLWSWDPVGMGSGNVPQYFLTRDDGAAVSGSTGPYSSYIESGLTPGFSYRSMVRAFDSGANAANPDIRYSLDSATATGVTAALQIPAPLGLAGTPLSPSTIRWDWTAPPFLCPTYGYNVTDAQTGALLVTLGANAAPTWAQGPLGANTLSSVRVQGFDLLQPGGGFLSASATNYSQANPPANITASNVTQTSLQLNWVGAGNPAYTRYEIALSPDNFATQSLPYPVSSNRTGSTATISGLSAGTTYYFRVRAINGRDSDPYGTLFTATASGAFMTLTNVPALSGTTLSSVTIRWDWSAVTGASGYRLYEANGPLIQDGPLLTHTSGNLSANTPYGLQILAYNGQGLGQRSDTVFTFTYSTNAVVPVVLGVGSNTINYSWAPNGNAPFTFYEINVATDARFAVVVATKSVGGTSILIRDLYPATTYYARVYSISGGQVNSATSFFQSTMTNANALVTVSSSPPTVYASPLSLLGLWHLDENGGVSAADSSGQGNTAALACLTNACTSTPTYTAGPPSLSSAVTFSGFPDSLIKVANAAYNFTGSMTIEVWSKPATLAMPDGAALAAQGDGGAEQFALDIVQTGGQKRYRFMPKPGFVAVATSTIRNGQWDHVAGVYDSAAGGSGAIYINGVLSATVAGVGAARLSTTNTLTFGSRRSAAGSYDLGYTGTLDEVRFSNTAYTAAQVRADFLGSYPTQVTLPPPNDKLQLTVPPNAFGGPAVFYASSDPLNNPIRISFSLLSDGLLNAPTGQTLLPGSLVEIVPTVGGQAFTTNLGSPATLTMPLADANGDGLLDGLKPEVALSSVRMYTLNTSVLKWEALPTTVDIAARKAAGQTPHFSVFALFGVSAIGQTLSQVRVFPIPWHPGSGSSAFSAAQLTFDKLPVDGTIRIFTLSGEKVTDLSFSGLQNGQLKWDGKNSSGKLIASGVYFAYVKNALNGATSVIKFAIEK